jgi:hypothetical protein
MPHAARNENERTSQTGKADATPAPDVDYGAELRMNRIARRAHEIYEARGGQHGKALEDWLQAEREIDAESSDDDPTRR